MTSTCAGLYRVPAKVNLFLEVHGRRRDGYHELETIMQTISLFDTLIVEKTDGPIRVQGFEEAGVADEDNLVPIAARKLRDVAGTSSGCVIAVEKRIPAGRGLGGGSADAAAALVALNELWDCSLSYEDLHGLAGEIGSDVAFFLVGGTAVCRGRGEQVQALACPVSLDLVVVAPPFGLATRSVYQTLDLRQPLETRGIDAMMKALADGAPQRAARAIFNRLEEPAVALAGDIAGVKERLLARGVLGAMVTGSGSGVFGIARDARHADLVAREIARDGLGDVVAVKTNVREDWMHGIKGDIV